jgi:hypothetical protein
MWWYLELVTHSIYLLLRMYVVSYMLTPYYLIFQLSYHLPSHHHVALPSPTQLVMPWIIIRLARSCWANAQVFANSKEWPICCVAWHRPFSWEAAWWIQFKLSLVDLMVSMAKKGSAALLHTDHCQPDPSSPDASLQVQLKTLQRILHDMRCLPDMASSPKQCHQATIMNRAYL